MSTPTNNESDRSIANSFFNEILESRRALAQMNQPLRGYATESIIPGRFSSGGDFILIEEAAFIIPPWAADNKDNKENIKDNDGKNKRIRLS